MSENVRCERGCGKKNRVSAKNAPEERTGGKGR